MSGAGSTAPPLLEMDISVVYFCFVGGAPTFGVMNSSRALFLSERKGRRQPSPRYVCREKRKESIVINTINISFNAASDNVHTKQHGKGLREEEE